MIPLTVNQLILAYQNANAVSPIANSIIIIADNGQIKLKLEDGSVKVVDENILTVLKLDGQTPVFTGDQGEQELYSFTLPANFFTQNGSTIETKIRVKYFAGANGLTGKITVKLDGFTIFTSNFVPFNKVNETGYTGLILNLLEMAELNGANSIANIGNLGFVAYDNTIAHTITVTYIDSANDPTNSFRGAFFKVTATL